MKRLEVRYADQAKTYLTAPDLAALAAVKLSATLEPARGVFLFGARAATLAGYVRGVLGP